MILKDFSISLLTPPDPLVLVGCGRLICRLRLTHLILGSLPWLSFLILLVFAFSPSAGASILSSGSSLLWLGRRTQLLSGRSLCCCRLVSEGSSVCLAVPLRCPPERHSLDLAAKTLCEEMRERSGSHQQQPP